MQRRKFIELGALATTGVLTYSSGLSISKAPGDTINIGIIGL